MFKSREDRLNDKSRYRKWFIKWYEDSSNTDDIINYCNNSKYQFVYICHDKDVFDSDDIERGIKKGDLKKKHFHAWINFKDGCTYKSLSNKLGIDIMDIDICRNDTSAIEYLIHLNDSDKYQYDISEVKGNALNKAYRIFSKHNCDENDIAFDILGIIYSYDSYVSIYTLVSDICKSGYFSEFRRCYTLYKDIYLERMNLLISKKVKSNESKS